MNFDRLLTLAQQEEVLQLLHAAGFHRAIKAASIRGLVWAAAGTNVRRQATVLAIVEAFLEGCEDAAA